MNELSHSFESMPVPPRGLTDVKHRARKRLVTRRRRAFFASVVALFVVPLPNMAIGYFFNQGQSITMEPVEGGGQLPQFDSDDSSVFFGASISPSWADIAPWLLLVGALLILATQLGLWLSARRADEAKMHWPWYALITVGTGIGLFLLGLWASL